MTNPKNNKIKQNNHESEFNFDCGVHDDGTVINNAEVRRMISLEREIQMTKNMPKWKQVSKKIARHFKKQTKFELQSTDIFVNTFASLSDVDGDYAIKLLEDVGVLIHQLSKGKSYSDYTFAIVVFTKLRTNKPIIQTEMLSKMKAFLKNIFTRQELQSEDIFLSARSYLDKYEEFKNSPIFDKMYKFMLYAMSLSLFDKIGISFDTFGYTKLEQEALKKKYHKNSIGFIHMVADTILFLCERGYQIIKTGDIDVMFHAPGTYEKWYDESQLLKRQSTLLHDPEAHGFTECEFLATLDDKIEKGHSILKHATRIGDYERKRVRFILDEISSIRDDCLTSKNARQHRTPPFSILVYGESSIGKSTVIQLLYYHFGKVKNLPLGDEYKFTRNASAKFWDGFKSSQWCVILDDVAYLNPNKAASGDPSCLEFIQVVNGVPFVPDQASLNDKGRTPLRSKLVIATTNTEDLNAHHYFSHASAAQRRFPFIIEPKPKNEYLKNGTMMDSSKVPVSEGGYPDLWTWTVKVVKPVSIKSNQKKADIEILFQDADLKTFLKWYNGAITAFDDDQKKVSQSNEDIKETHICPSCYLPVDDMCDCLQSMDNITFSFYFSINYVLFTFLFYSTLFYCRSSIFRKCCSYMPTYAKRKISHAYEFLLDELDHAKRQIVQKAFWIHLGKKVQEQLQTPKFLIILASIVVSSLSLYKLSKLFKREVQGTSTSKNTHIGVRPNADDKSWEDVWIKNDFQLSKFDLTDTITSSKGLDINQIYKMFWRNCAHMRIKVSDNVFRCSKPICLFGQYYLVNNHCVPTLHEMEVELTFQISKTGVNENHKFQIRASQIFRFPEQDLCILFFNNLPPKRDITGYFASEKMQCKVNGCYLNRSYDGSEFKNDVRRIIKHDSFNIGSLNASPMVWSGMSTIKTLNGDCGSILVGSTPQGPVIMGIHVMANNLKQCYAVSVSKEFINTFKQSIDTPQIQSGVPMLSAPSAQRELIDLHKKSVFRYINNGTASVFGSFTGFRGKMKSTVETTPMATFLAERNYKIKYGEPEMNSWEPWRIAALDMVNPVTKLDNNVVNECIEAYTQDILRNISKERLKQLEVYDDFTAINGAQGVLYVDKLNRNTSAGNPWKKSKRHFLEQTAPQHGMQDPVNVSEEIMERVIQIIDTYKEGKRAYPNFCAHLKDEAVSFAKMKAKKTRVFTGAPFDWSIVVRKYLLSFIRVMQSERFLFEAAPGTIAQSTEWGDIYEYLTEFGTDKIVAGDYKAFDKRMPPQMILGAFKVIKDVCAASGNFDSVDLTIIDGIAYDTAFPLVDFNGDLVEFYGSNPSGHPLTVIINSIVNSLYMRYCYVTLNPKFTVSTFKRDVRLMTYGDDNIMGVSNDARWFNHTAIAQVLSDIDITYTMADKEAASIPYINISEASFLKRTWKWDKDVEAYLCPLDHDSIEKMLMVWTRSKTISAEEQCIAVISSAIKEYFYYGKNTFEKRRVLFQEMIKSLQLELWVEESTLPTYEQLKKDFWRHSLKQAKTE